MAITTTDRLNYLNETKSLLKDAINDRGGEITNQTPFRNYVDEIDNLQVNVVNGVIEKYKATTANISANTFVEFVTSQTVTPSTPSQHSTGMYTGDNISAVKLSNDKVFIAHSYGASHYLYGTVLTISGSTISEIGEMTQLSDVEQTSDIISIVKLSNDKVFIAHSRSNNYYLYGMVCTISGTSITAGTDTSILSNSYYGYAVSAVKVSDNSVFIAHCRSSSNYYLYGIVCTISGTTITAGTDTQLSNTTQAGYVVSAVKVSDDKVFIAHSRSNNYYLYGMVCTISGTSITAGTDTSIDANSYSGYAISAVKVSDNSVFIAHCRSSSNYYLYGIVCTISGTTITAGTDTQLSTTSYSGFVISAVKSSEGSIFIAHSYNSNTSNNYYLYGMVCTISGTTITSGTDTALVTNAYSGGVFSAVVFGSSIFIPFGRRTNTSYPYDLYSEMVTDAIKIQASTDTIDGITKTDCTTTTDGEVYVLE